ncbi:hypothetical protein ACH4OW_26820 [Streptomyces sp. NPDC017056]|uniref:hypothetical protein n=1 Tax=Streptomyces sp. NPDC017056 TaxID=3364973 RepID=UPI0037A1F965
MTRQPYLALTSAVADAPKAAVDSIAVLVAALVATLGADAAPGTAAAPAAPAAQAGTAAPAAGGARS